MSDYLGSSKKQIYVTAPVGADIDLLDAAQLGGVSRQIHVLTNGDLSYISSGNSTLTLVPVVAGMVFNVQAKEITAGTTASLLVMD